MRALIVANNISMRMGGEAVLPFHYFRELRALGVDVIALTHARVRDELRASEIWEEGRFHFIEDSAPERVVHQAGKNAPAAIRDRVFLGTISAITNARIAKAARRLVRDHQVDLIHQPTPVSPKSPSFLSNMPVPVIIGPMNGGMSFPDAFAQEYGQGSLAAVSAARRLSGLVNRLIPGKLTAYAVLVANERTRAALPSVIDPARVRVLVENGVDLSLFDAPPQAKPEAPLFVFVGRLIWLKGVDLMIRAFEGADPAARLVIVGDGPERKRLEEIAAASPAGERISFLGFKPQAEIRDLLTGATALVLPSLHECGGAVILEAFACSTPAIATDWGGPRDYVTPETGILVSPDGRAPFIEGLTAAMNRLAGDRDQAAQMGAAARDHVVANFSWRAKALQMIEIYKEAASATQKKAAR